MLLCILFLPTPKIKPLAGDALEGLLQTLIAEICILQQVVSREAEKMTVDHMNRAQCHIAE